MSSFCNVFKHFSTPFLKNMLEFWPANDLEKLIDFYGSNAELCEYS